MEPEELAKFLARRLRESGIEKTPAELKGMAGYQILRFAQDGVPLSYEAALLMSEKIFHAVQTGKRFAHLLEAE